MSKHLFYLLSPTHLISALSAFYSVDHNDDDSIEILVHFPNPNEEVLFEIKKVIVEMTIGFEHITNIFTFSVKDKKELLWGKKISQSIKKFKERFKSNDFESIYYPHDVDGGMCQFIAMSFPHSQRICFGDAFGGVFEKSFLTGLIIKKNYLKIFLHFLLNNFRKFISLFSLFEMDLSGFVEEFRANKAVLILPVDQSGKFLRNTILEVCPKEIVIKTMKQIYQNLESLRKYVEILLSQKSEKIRYLLITENYAECNAIDFGKEIEMYCSIINIYCEEDSIIYIKSHPGEFLPRNQKIKEKLSPRFCIIALEDNYKRYPIELWEDLILNTKTICMSSPVLTLKYLYNIDVMNPMSSEFIEKWFPSFLWKSYKNAEDLYMQPLKRLESWNGKEVLYSGGKDI